MVLIRFERNLGCKINFSLVGVVFTNEMTKVIRLVINKHNLRSCDSIMHAK